MSPFLFEKGYHIFSDVVPLDLCQAVVKDIEEHTEDGKWGSIDPSGLVEMYHYQSMWDVRQHPKVYECFCQIFGSEQLFVTIDRICRKIPFSNVTFTSEWPGFIHWDLNPNIWPRIRQVQGLVALTDTTEEMGGFWCLPALYQDLDRWLSTQPTCKVLMTSFGVDKEGERAYYYSPPIPNDVWYKWFREQYGEEFQKEESWPIEKVPMKAGDLLVWDSYLPHGNGQNKSDQIRYCQYVSMEPASFGSRLRSERIHCWEKNIPPSGLAFFGDPRGIEQKKDPAKLTDLGRKLLGLHLWSTNL